MVIEYGYDQEQMKTLGIYLAAQLLDALNDLRHVTVVPACMHLRFVGWIRPYRRKLVTAASAQPNRQLTSAAHPGRPRNERTHP
jgi:hypothetical protein